MLLSLIAVVCSFATVQAEKRTITVTAAGQFASIGSSALSQVDTLILSGPLNGNG
jgi:hypothetical protein